MAQEIPNDHDEIASRQNAKYRTGYARLVTMLVGFVLVMVVLLSMFVLVTWMPNSPSYYATTTNGQIYPMQSLSEPVVTDNYLRQWVSAVAGGVYTVSFNDWQNQLKQYQNDFTPLAWQDLQNAYNNGFANNLVQNQLVASAVVTQSPRILDRSIINGRYTWTVIVPVMVNFTSAGAQSLQKITLSLTISRVPVLSDAQGIQISYLHAKLEAQGAS
jgi:intracellular multiplication protein IcmL